MCMFTSGYYPLTHWDAAEPAVRSLWWRVAHGATCNPLWHWRGGWPRSWDGWPLGPKMGSFSMFQQRLCVVYLWCNFTVSPFFCFGIDHWNWQWNDSKVGEVLMNMRTLRKKVWINGMSQMSHPSGKGRFRMLREKTVRIERLESNYIV